MATVVYLKNLSQSCWIKNKTPLEKFAHVKPNLSKLRVVGCAAWALVWKGARDSKLQPGATLCCLFGTRSIQLTPTSQTSTSSISTPVNAFKVVGGEEVMGDVEVVGDEEGVGDEELVGAGGQGNEGQNEVEQDNQDQLNKLVRYPGWQYEEEPRLAREHTPSPELEEQQPEQMQTRSGRTFGLISQYPEYEIELNDFLGRPGEQDFSPLDA
ncbi:hypothetical protein TREMEDRAFT_58024 [Tremella mesenterica DSM 1558]|uniref:uncharacterized protein n=1 Tax=Tremella mesenterica (strain ATCC 24925 / CBS 8224 / DSM 1558 / NBRC 9311 / NRRL Y-6157 / RJB 2259-6 / UBC 559-6) TaxID=578456 RepID=UPI0003F49218|nr:uncharacterized protein TREMEDRAFT_58024 [Tremella mesenterica DSM 1558]EIW71895.1 hypothetical protein TREMEDRAFT_58024 [Tremella mesenterica DSM 1558]